MSVRSSPRVELPITLDLDEGIDRHRLNQLRDRFCRLHAVRLARTRSALGMRQQRVLDLLPLIFHLNHPALPGFLDTTCPKGFRGYTPDTSSLQQAQCVARTFHWRPDKRLTPQLHALYLMGSTGSVAHSGASDLDVWLCHDPALKPAEVACLQRKADAVCRWADEQGQELHIFVMTAEQFRAGRTAEQVDSENCGSAQHTLLLDEFYRTAIHLAGGYPLWWLIPADQEGDYARWARQLCDCRFVREDAFVDFGPVPRLPPGEFLGAGVWQLYKGIDDPWKAILKLMLIESYARSEHAEPLALAYKRRVHGGGVQADDVDPYILLYRHLEAYLAQETERLELVRRCLYLKTGLRLSRVERQQQRDDWRVRLLEQIVTAWGWTLTQLRRLDRRAQWRLGEVQRERRVIVNELTRGYRELSLLAREHKVRPNIREDDLVLLGRKLYAAFQRKAGKIELINNGIAPSLSEDSLAFHHASARPQAEPAEDWRVYRDLASPADAEGQPVLRRSLSLIELLVWAHANGILTRATRLNVQAGQTQLEVAELRGLMQVLAQALPVPLPAVAAEALRAPPRPRRILLFVNVGLDPLHALSERGLQKLSSQNDALGFSSQRDNLVLTLDQVVLNSWNEILVSRYAQGDTLVQCLQQYLAQRIALGGPAPQLSVHCLCSSRAAAIARRVGELFRDVSTRFLGQLASAPRYVISLGTRECVLELDKDEPHLVTFDTREALLEFLAQPRGRYAPIVADRLAWLDSPALRLICETHTPHSLQIYYQREEIQTQVWVVDEHGSLLGWGVPSAEPGASSRQWLLPLLRFLYRVLERRQIRGNGSELPLLMCHEIMPVAERWCCERRPLPSDAADSATLDVQALACALPGMPLAFDIYCGDQVFGALEYGEDQFLAVARYILAKRRAGPRYPVYLTDLSLPHDLELGLYPQTLQTVQYLRERVRLEARLNQALRDVDGG